MKRVPVLWFVEHRAREFDVACAVKCLAEAMYSVEIRIRNIYLHAARVLAEPEPAIVVHPFFYRAEGALGTEHYVKAWPRALHFNLAWEELFYSANARVKGPSDDFARTRVVHHAWGEFYERFLVEHGVSRERIHVNGNPAYQLYKRPYSEVLPGRAALAARHGLEPSDPWVFIPENYRWAFQPPHKLKKIAASAAHLGELEEMREYCIRSLRTVLAWSNDVARSGAAIIILRPRPATSTAQMLEFVQEAIGTPADRLRVSKSGTVREWILASDVVISSFSTTLIEAAIAGKPALMAEPCPLPAGLHADWHRHVPRLRTEDEFRSACAAGCSFASGSGALSAWAHAEMLANGDPIRGLARLIGRYASDTANPPRGSAGIFRRMGELMESRRARIEGARTISINHETHEGDEFTDVDVGERVAEWGRVLNGEQARSGAAGATA